MNQPQVVVVGAGAAGILAAWRAASLGARVLLLEKNDRIGMKILLSGGGRCNITHAGTVEEVLAGFPPAEARFLRPALHRFPNSRIVQMLEDRGLEVCTRADGRICPLHGNARDVVRILGRYVDEAGVSLRLGAAVTAIERDSEGVSCVRMHGRALPVRRVVLAVGGSSYPGTGTTGDGWRWAAALGHTVVKPRAALAPIFLEHPRPDWAGVALRGCVVKARQEGREFARWRGDLLFTHRGVSGPAVLAVSRQVAERRPRGPVLLEADLFPDVDHAGLSARIQDAARRHPRRTLRGLVEELAPDRVAVALLEAAGVESETRGAHLVQRARSRLAGALKGWQLGMVQHVPLEKGEVVAGGIALDEVDPHSLRSRVVPGLWVCGEVLDVAGQVGGYNLQAAFSTGFVAGESAALGVLSASI